MDPGRRSQTYFCSASFIPWIAMPVIAAAASAGASSTWIGAISFLALEVGMILFTLWVTYDVLRNGNSTAPVAFLFLPIAQWPAFILVLLVALFFGWRIRPDFLKEEADLSPPPRA
jgi:hypothetical protein